MIAMSSAEIEQLLGASRIGRLALTGNDKKPYVIPLPFCWLDDSLYLRLPLSGRKGSILRENDQVCFEVDWFTDSLSDYASVLIEGQIVPVLNPAEKLHVHEVNQHKYLKLRGGHRPGHGRKAQPDALPIQKVIPSSISGRKKERRTVERLAS